MIILIMIKILVIIVSITMIIIITTKALKKTSLIVFIKITRETKRKQRKGTKIIIKNKRKIRF